MAARVTSVFLYVKDVRRSLEFYNEVVGAEIVQVHAEEEGAPYSLAILRIGDFTLCCILKSRMRMSLPTPASASEFTCRFRFPTWMRFISIAWMKVRSWPSRANRPIRTGDGASSRFAIPTALYGRSTRINRVVSGRFEDLSSVRIRRRNQPIRRSRFLMSVALSRIVSQLIWSALALSDGVNPPSGPTARITGRSGRDRRPMR